LARLRKDGLQGRSEDGSRNCGSPRFRCDLPYPSYKTYADFEMSNSTDCQRGMPLTLAFKVICRDIGLEPTS
jgi:hypothetical protein